MFGNKKYCFECNEKEVRNKYSYFCEDCFREELRKSEKEVLA